MSDQQPGPGGQPPGHPSPYGQQPPPGGPSHGGQYGSPPPQYNPQYGSALGAQPYTAAYGGQRDPDKRPGTVTAAGITTLVVAGLTLVLMVVSILGMLAARSAFVRALEEEPAFAETGIDVDDAFGLIVGAVGLFALWSLVACVLAVMAMRRWNAGRIMLVVSAALTALVSVVAIGSLVSAIPLIAAITVIVLLFTGGANDWYARRGPGGGAGHGGPVHAGWEQQGQQWSQQYGAPPYPGQQYAAPAGQQHGAPSYPGRPDEQATQQQPDREPGDGGDDRPVQRPWG
jgi:hypothetical protein